ncbi:hypothetical protein VNO77_29766 [Canavalia gladiata]|uniref:Uncharacterized protein n=1 Tax=Canavalia gladiata TaxID=3824 RepID=A0AAN9Q6T7_CANGL
MAGVQFYSLLHATSKSFLAKSCRPFLNNTVKNYGQTRNGNRSLLMAERAPSTAEEFQRVAAERAKERVRSESYGAQEGAIGEFKVESVKNRYKDSHRRGD